MGLAYTQWPKFRQNKRNTGLSPYQTKPLARLKWRYLTGNDIYYCSPAIGPDGTIYICSTDRYLYALNPDGTLKWRYNYGEYPAYSESTPVISADGTIYITSYHYNFSGGYWYSLLHAINPDGTPKWTYQAGGYPARSPAIADDGTIYVGISVSSTQAYLYALNPDGTLKWNYPTGSYIGECPAIDLDGTIYFGSHDYYLYALNPDGTLKWRTQTPHLRTIDGSPAIGNDGTIYFGAQDYLYALDLNGNVKWAYQTNDGEPPGTFSYYESSPAIGPDGTIYFVSNVGFHIHAVNPDGTPKYPYLADIFFVNSSPAISANGIIYVGGYDNYIYALNPNLSVKWRYPTGGRVYSSPAIDADGTVYVGSEDYHIYALQTDLLPAMRKPQRLNLMILASALED